MSAEGERFHGKWLDSRPSRLREVLRKCEVKLRPHECCRMPVYVRNAYRQCAAHCHYQIRLSKTWKKKCEQLLIKCIEEDRSDHIARYMLQEYIGSGGSADIGSPISGGSVQNTEDDVREDACKSVRELLSESVARLNSAQFKQSLDLCLQAEEHECHAELRDSVFDHKAVVLCRGDTQASSDVRKDCVNALDEKIKMLGCPKKISGYRCIQAKLYIAMQDYVTAEEIACIAYEEDESNTAALEVLSRCVARQHEDKDDQRKMLEKLLQVERLTATLVDQVAFLYEHLEENEEALKYLQKNVGEKGDFAENHYLWYRYFGLRIQCAKGNCEDELFRSIRDEIDDKIHEWTKKDRSSSPETYIDFSFIASIEALKMKMTDNADEKTKIAKRAAKFGFDRDAFEQLKSAFPPNPDVKEKVLRWRVYTTHSRLIIGLYLCKLGRCFPDKNDDFLEEVIKDVAERLLFACTSKENPCSESWKSLLLHDLCKLQVEWDIKFKPKENVTICSSLIEKLREMKMEDVDVKCIDRLWNSRESLLHRCFYLGHDRLLRATMRKDIKHGIMYPKKTDDTKHSAKDHVKRFYYETSFLSFATIFESVLFRTLQQFAQVKGSSFEEVNGEMRIIYEFDPEKIPFSDSYLPEQEEPSDNCDFLVKKRMEKEQECVLRCRDGVSTLDASQKWDIFQIAWKSKKGERFWEVLRDQRDFELAREMIPKKFTPLGCLFVDTFESFCQPKTSKSSKKCTLEIFILRSTRVLGQQRLQDVVAMAIESSRS